MQWPTPLRAGVRLHRRIDALSNRNDAVTATCNRFSSVHRRFAPIYVDILGDHWLSLNWSQHHAHELLDFSQECYHAISEYQSYLGVRGQRFFEYMLQEDLLSQYDQWVHVEQALHSVLRRLDKAQDFESVNTEMLGLVEAGSAEFVRYYPQLRSAWELWNAFDAIANNT